MLFVLIIQKCIEMSTRLRYDGFEQRNSICSDEQSKGGGDKVNIRKRTMAQVSRLYYEENMTQQQIGKKLELSRMKVSRLLQKAKEEGVVKILIDYSGVYPELEEDIMKKYKVKDVIIIDSFTGLSSKQQIAQATAYYLEKHLKNNTTVAVGWGTTIRSIPEYIHSIEATGILFSPIIGGHGQSELGMHATTISASLAEKTNGQSLSLIAPALVHSKAERSILVSDPQIQYVLEKTADADYAVFSLGNPLAQDSSIRKSGYISEKDLRQLSEEDAVCDIVSISFLNKENKECCTNITDRCVGITGEQLKKIPNKICAVEGEEKYESVKAALQAGYIDILITNQNVAQYLSEH